MFDPYISQFLRDVGHCISIVFQTVELFIGVSYFVGSKVVEGFSWLISACIEGYRGTSEFAVIVRNEIIEFGTEIIRAVSLIYYILYTIAESFWIISVDLYNASLYFKDSFSRTVGNIAEFLRNCFVGIFTVVPNQVVAALSMIGDAAVNFVVVIKDIVLDFFLQLVLSPINVVFTLVKGLIDALILPITFIRQMPPASFLGLIVVLLAIFLCRRFVRYVVLMNVRIVFNSVVSAFHGLTSISSRIRIPNIVKFPGWPIVSSPSHVDVGCNAKAVCVICQDKAVSFMSNPCKHVCLCEVCVFDLYQHDTRCPICRGWVSEYERVFIA